MTAFTKKMYVAHYQLWRQISSFIAAEIRIEVKEHVA